MTFVPPTKGITMLLDEPFFSGGTHTTDVPFVLPVAIAGHPYRMELSHYQRQTIERFRNPYDVSQEPGEHSLNIKGPWLRSASRWDNGAGQDFWDIFDSDRTRFRTSKGVDVWTNQHRAQLLHDTRNIRSSAQTNLNVLSTGTYLYVVDGQQVYSTADPTGASPTWTSAVIHNGEAAVNVNGIATDGAVVYAALGVNGIHRTTVGASASTHLSGYAATLVQYANGRLLAANSNDISEINSSGVATTLMTHRVSTFAWTSIAGAPDGIFIGGNSGDRNEIYFIGLKSDKSLDAPVFACSLPFGETLNAMTFYNGVMILATSVGLRLATVTSGGGLAYDNAVLIPGGCAAVEPQGSYVWFTWKNFDSASTGLGRANLARFTDVLVPAYASDLMAAGSGTVNGVASYSSKRYFAVAALGIFAEFTDLVASGTLSSGYINFSTTDKKVAISVDVRHEPLNGTVQIDMPLEDGTTLSVGLSQLALSLGPTGPLAVPTTSSETFEIKLTLSRSAADHTLGPLMRRWTFRALITPGRVDQIAVPIWLTETVMTMDAAGGTERAQDPLGEFLFLKGLETSGQPIVYQEGTQSYTCYVERVDVPPDPLRKWTADRSFPQGLVVVNLVTLEPAA